MNGDLLMYPEGDQSVPPSGVMPAGGYYFDSIIRQEPIEEDKLNPKEWAEQMYSVYTDEELRHFEDTAKWYYEHTDYALIGSFWGGNFGDIALSLMSIPNLIGVVFLTGTLKVISDEYFSRKHLTYKEYLEKKGHSVQ